MKRTQTTRERAVGQFFGDAPTRRRQAMGSGSVKMPHLDGVTRQLGKELDAMLLAYLRHDEVAAVPVARLWKECELWIYRRATYCDHVRAKELLTSQPTTADRWSCPCGLCVDRCTRDL